MFPSFNVPRQRVPINAVVDLCVIGGGAAGLAAAVSAGRCGLKVLLVEKYGFCGGATVAGLSGTICGLFSSGPKPRQIVRGFAGEFHKRLREQNGVGAPVRFGRTMLVPHDSFAWKRLADRFLLDTGVRVLFHANFITAYAREDKIHTLLLRGMEGLIAVKAAQVIDASGDAEVVHSIGAETTTGADGLVQTPTMIFRVGGVEMNAFLALDPRRICDAVSDANRSGGFSLPRTHVYLFPMPNGAEVLCNMTRITYPDGRVPSGLSSEDISFAEIEGRRQASEYACFLREKVPGFERSYLVDTGAQVGIRQTRSLCGKQRLTNDDVTGARKIPGAATFSAWPIESHGGGEPKIVFLENDTYDIPFETLIPLRGRNLLVAGRCLSAEHEALASARVTAQCLGMGYAAGAASALMLRERMEAQALTGVEVETWMHSRGLQTAWEG